MKFKSTLLILLTVILLFGQSCSKNNKMKLLVFSKTEGFRHESINAGIEAFKKMSEEKGFEVDFTEEAEQFKEKNLQNYHTVVFLNTTGDILNSEQQEAFERYIQAGGGYVGIHSATDTEYDWPWYGELAGAYFLDHPSTPSNVQTGTITVVEKDHLSTQGMPEEFEWTDEFYSFKNISSNITPLLTIDDNSYIGGNNPDYHPMAWYQEFDGGRSFYTALGHTDESFSDPLFLNHLWGGIQYASGGDKLNKIVFSKSRPEANRFTKVVLADGLDEPMELTLLDENRILFIQRKGEVMLYNLTTETLKEVGRIPVSHKYVNREGKVSEAEDGLIGLNKDPNFSKNNRIYMFYSDTARSSNVLSRFELKNDTILFAERIVMLEVPVQREECCHTGGSIEWDRQGNLYLSTGDNTNPHGSNGYSPSDDRPGREPWDAQKSSANTNDLRGKIIRITPQEDGTYTIPEGNLFPEGTPKTRPEIYSMGHRNPFRISVDQHTGFVYWGEVGPDARDPHADRGSEGLDELNQARGPGNFGWPHFVGDNRAYNQYDFDTEVSGPKWNPEKPVNQSRNNTGLEELPPAVGAMVWYPYGESDDFPIMGSGGRNAMAGPVYYYDDFKNAERRWPKYYDKKFFAYEWMRGMILPISMDEEGNLTRIERFLPDMEFNNPMDMVFASNGDLYMLEYGTGWFVQNDNARLIRIEYNGGNRKPIVNAFVDKPGGTIPLKIHLNGDNVKDLDDDQLNFKWEVTSDNGFKQVFKTQSAAITLDQPGLYTAVLTVDDGRGGVTTSTHEIAAGNSLPVVDILFPGANKSFYSAGKVLDYQVLVSDEEDGDLESGIDPSEVTFTIDYLKEGFDKNIISMGHQTADEEAIVVSKGKKLIDESDCSSCHNVNRESIGPSYFEVAKRYRTNVTAVRFLSDKIINGGSGNWGEVPMAAHPAISLEDATDMAKYILSLGLEESKLPLAGKYKIELPADDKGVGTYFIRASYSDKGANGLPSVRAEKVLTLRNANLDVHGFDAENDIMKLTFSDQKILIAQNSGASVMLKNIDLNGIAAIVVAGLAPQAQLEAVGGKVELRIGSSDGDLVGESELLKSTEALSFNPTILSIPFMAAEEMLESNQDLYLVFTNPDVSDKNVMAVLAVQVILK